MEPRIRILRHKLRWWLLGFVALAIVCLLIFIGLCGSFNRPNGPFEKVSMHQELEPKVSAEDIANVEIHLAGAHLELAMVSNISHPKISIYGEEQTEETPQVDIAGNRMVIGYLNDAVSKNMTLRVLLPQNSLRTLNIEVKKGKDITLDGMRADHVSISGDAENIDVSKVNANRLSLTSERANIRSEDNYVNQMNVTGGKGNIIIRHNKTKILETTSQSGDVFMYDTRFKGQYRVQTKDGNITTVSRFLPWSMMIQAKASGTGDVNMTYQKGLWKKPDIISSEAKMWIGSVGNNPANAMDLSTENGHITIAKRDRYTDIHNKE